MHHTDMPTTPCQTGDGDMGDFSRIPVVIPVRVECFRTSQAAPLAVVPGTLLDIGRGGGRVRVRREFPPRTRLVISLPIGMPGLWLPAELIWACHLSDGGQEPAVYGVRWVEPLSSTILETILPRPWHWR
jgi:hypothetical protein